MIIWLVTKKRKLSPPWARSTGCCESVWGPWWQLVLRLKGWAAAVAVRCCTVWTRWWNCLSAGSLWCPGRSPWGFEVSGPPCSGTWNQRSLAFLMVATMWPAYVRFLWMTTPSYLNLSTLSTPEWFYVYRVGCDSPLIIVGSLIATGDKLHN